MVDVTGRLAITTNNYTVHSGAEYEHMQRGVSLCAHCRTVLPVVTDNSSYMLHCSKRCSYQVFGTSRPTDRDVTVDGPQGPCHYDSRPSCEPSFLATRHLSILSAGTSTRYITSILPYLFPLLPSYTCTRRTVVAASRNVDTRTWSDAKHDMADARNPCAGVRCQMAQGPAGHLQDS